jgi:ABC-type multidrug transport system fused ATPase/permease subunit
VSFEYEPGRPVLHAVDFVATPGQSIALVGHTRPTQRCGGGV